MRQNIPILFVSQSLSWTRFFIPVIALFFIASKVSIEEFAVISSLFALTILLFEVPSGVVADLIGKKKALTISKALYVAEIMILWLGEGFWLFLFAKLISGIGVSLTSGTAESMFYDTLKKQKKKKQHQKLYGQLEMCTSIVMGVAFVAGGVMLAWDSKLPALASLPFAILNFVLVLFLEEPYKPSKKFGLHSAYSHTRDGLSEVWNNLRLTRLFSLSIPIATVIAITLQYSSAYLESVSVPVSVIGGIAFMAMLIKAWASHYADKFTKLFERIGPLVAVRIGLLFTLLLLGLALPYWGAVFYLILPVWWGFYNVIMNHNVNEIANTENRTTLLSIRNMGDNLGAFLVFPIFGAIAESSGFGTAFIALATLYALYLLFFTTVLPKTTSS